MNSVMQGFNFEKLSGKREKERERERGERKRERESHRRPPDFATVPAELLYTHRTESLPTSFPAKPPNFTANGRRTRPDRTSEVWRRFFPSTAGHRESALFRPFSGHTRLTALILSSSPAYPPKITAIGPPTRRDRSVFRRGVENLQTVISPPSDLRFAHRRSRWIALLTIYKSAKFHSKRPPSEITVPATVAGDVAARRKLLFRRVPRKFRPAPVRSVRPPEPKSDFRFHQFATVWENCGAETRKASR